MEAPKCKLCGERHYGLCAVTDNGPAIQRAGKKIPRGAPSKSQASRAASSTNVPESAVTADLATGASNTPQNDGTSGFPSPKAKFDRNAYQREYMRKRRAKEAGK